MEFRQLGGSGFKVAALSLGTGTFGGGGELFKAWGSSDVAEATRLVNICLDAGLNMFEWELMPLALDQKVGAVVWSPLGWGRLTGKIRRGQPKPDISRLQSKLATDLGPPISDELVYRVVDALDEVARETAKTVPQIALNGLLQRPSAANVIIGARNEEQLRQNLGAVGWHLTSAQVARLDAASATTLPYPYWHQRGFGERNPPPV